MDPNIVKAFLELAQVDFIRLVNLIQHFFMSNQTVYDVKHKSPMLLAFCYVTSQCNLPEVMTSGFSLDVDDLYIF